jgi:hypothetical protein
MGIMGPAKEKIYLCSMDDELSNSGWLDLGGRYLSQSSAVYVVAK